jgi:biuret amidohydrolase
MMQLQAKPFSYHFEVKHTALLVIDMQRDFIEPAGFGASLGNDVSLLSAIVPACQRVLAAWREAGGLVVHTREAHRSDLSDCPPAKRNRGNPSLRIGDAGPMGRILVAGEPGSEIIAQLKPDEGEIAIDKPGITHLIFMGVTTEVCVQTSMREANDRGYESLLLEDCTESYFPQFKASTLEMLRAQGGIIGWTAMSRQLFAAMAAATNPQR